MPWKPEIGWLASDLYMGGMEVAQAPRTVLKKQLAAASSLGYEMKTGVECEYFLISADGTAISDASDKAEKPCYDQSALMRRYEVIKEICDAMLTLGWGAYQNDHEDANGQFEMNWNYDAALLTADRHVFFKFNGQVHRREAWPARHLHAEALHQPHGLGLPRACLALEQGQERLLRFQGRAGASQTSAIISSAA